MTAAIDGWTASNSLSDAPPRPAGQSVSGSAPASPSATPDAHMEPASHDDAPSRPTPEGPTS